MHPLDSLEIALQARGPSGVRRAINSADLTSAAKIELAALRWSWWWSHQVDIADTLPGDVRTWSCLPPLASCADLVIPEGLDSERVRRIPLHEDTAAWEAGSVFVRFEERFKTELVHHGLPTSFAHGLVGAFAEMASNAAEHARSDLPPVAAYEVSEHAWEFSVTDLGCGMLGSLQRNPKYRDLTDDVNAIRLAVQNDVSATGFAGRGHGFACLFKALADRQCTLRFRSLEATANWIGSGPAAGTLRFDYAPRRQGFHVRVSSPRPRRAA